LNESALVADEAQRIEPAIRKKSTLVSVAPQLAALRGVFVPKASGRRGERFCGRLQNTAPSVAHSNTHCVHQLSVFPMAIANAMAAAEIKELIRTNRSQKGRVQAIIAV